MCYMSRVGIRELRQNLSVYLRRVKRGESLEVTEHGRPVALLAPLPEPASVRAMLLASGKLVPATSAPAALGAPPSSLAASVSVSEALAEERGERL
jgi:prevent-host-death family protein